MSITESQVRFWARDELRKILEKGLMYSDEVRPPAPKPAGPMPENIAHLIDEVNGELRPKHYLQDNDYKTVSTWARANGFEYVKATNGTAGHWRKKQ